MPSVARLGMHALSGCDTTCGKGKISALNTLFTHDFPGLADVLGGVDTTHTDLVEVSAYVSSASRPQWGLPASNSSLINIIIRRRKPLKCSNIRKHALLAHLHNYCGKQQADHQGPPNESAGITHFGWEVRPGQHPNPCHCSC